MSQFAYNKTEFQQVFVLAPKAPSLNYFHEHLQKDF
jgi:hypothetical protein